MGLAGEPSLVITKGRHAKPLRTIVLACFVREPRSSLRSPGTAFERILLLSLSPPTMHSLRTVPAIITSRRYSRWENVRPTEEDRYCTIAVGLLLLVVWSKLEDIMELGLGYAIAGATCQGRQRVGFRRTDHHFAHEVRDSHLSIICKVSRYPILGGT
ncbi:uncharacterized protein BJX67DRAFT_76140 [Aspergillus lucknowensis]|uniref:Uncharacterized protein n=1 Tax=Aspergillus lucknowensis TaxID=176173 RepID=A0ABR4LU84_9EURO